MSGFPATNNVGSMNDQIKENVNSRETPIVRKYFANWDMERKLKSDQYTKFDREKFFLVEPETTFDFLFQEFMTRRIDRFASVSCFK